MHFECRPRQTIWVGSRTPCVDKLLEINYPDKYTFFIDYNNNKGVLLCLFPYKGHQPKEDRFDGSCESNSLIVLPSRAQSANRYPFHYGSTDISVKFQEGLPA
jgi:hypothetical protein